MRLAQWRGSLRGRRGAVGACGMVAGLAVVLAACGPVSAGSTSVGTTPVSGGIATYATLPGFPANYIFPFTPPEDFTATNSDDFQYLMYRPLYWFGDGKKPFLNTKLSLADPPTFKNQQVTIKLKPNQWSNGEPVTAQNVMFWMNMLQAEKPNADKGLEWAGYIPGYFPDDVTNIHAVGTTKVVMTIKGAYSEDWFTYNELSQITPMPSAWDVTGPGKQSHCDTVIADCRAVYNYLTTDAGTPAKWTSFGGGLWTVVDGPWQLASATAQDVITMRYNSHYTGPAAAHHISTFELVPFLSEEAEFNVLEDPQSGQKIDVGYLPTVDAPVPPAGAQVGTNPVSLTGYKLSVVYPWALSYFPYNFTDPTAGPIFSQQYFRTAFQSLVDQEGVINGPMHGYGKATIGPVADYPVTTFLSPTLAKLGDQWTLNPTRAESLLKSHGWSFHPNGVDRCISPGTGPTNCGAHIRAGAQLKFNFLVATGIDYMESQVKELVSNASLVGIKISAVPKSATDVIDAVFAGAGPWQLAEWGAWTYAPDYLPTGEELFGGTSGNNGGHYDNPTNNTLINKTLQAKTSAKFLPALYNWEDFLARSLPVVYTPNVATLVESASNLVIGPQSPTLDLTPEDWYYLK